MFSSFISTNLQPFIDIEKYLITGYLIYALSQQILKRVLMMDYITYIQLIILKNTYHSQANR